jgi:hypothetical protein
MITVHDYVMETPQLTTAQWLGKEFSHHLVGQAVLHGDLTVSSTVGDEEISNIHMTYSLAARCVSICF